MKFQNHNMARLPRYSIFAVCAVWLAFVSPLYADTAAGVVLLKQMNAAASTLNYRGEFVYVKDGKIASMKVSQMQGESGSQQKVMALDGSMREIIQKDDTVACVLPDTGMGVREKRQLNKIFTSNISSKIDEVVRYYKIEHIGQARVAGRQCEQLKIIPKDEFRYGYALCIDSENQLLLRSELIALSGQILESFMFVSVEFDNTSAIEIASETPSKSLDWMDDDPAGMEGHDSMQKWHVIPNESGFEIEQYIERISPVMQAKMAHMVLGDGLASISVFVSPAEASENDSKKALSMGSLNSFTRKLDDYVITVIGEVPQQTVALIANNTEPN